MSQYSKCKGMFEQKYKLFYVFHGKEEFKSHNFFLICILNWPFLTDLIQAGKNYQQRICGIKDTPLLKMIIDGIHLQSGRLFACNMKRNRSTTCNLLGKDSQPVLYDRILERAMSRNMLWLPQLWDSVSSSGIFSIPLKVVFTLE